MHAYMTTKGRIVIPLEIRRKFGLKERVRIRVNIDERTHKIILTPTTHEHIQSLRGKYKGKGLLKSLTAEKRNARW